MPHVLDMSIVKLEKNVKNILLEWHTEGMSKQFEVHERKILTGFYATKACEYTHLRKQL